MNILFIDTEKIGVNLDGLISKGTSGTVSSMLWLAKGLSEYNENNVHVIGLGDDGDFENVVFTKIQSSNEIFEKVNQINDIDVIIIVGWAAKVALKYDLPGKVKIYWSHTKTRQFDKLLLDCLKSGALNCIVGVSAFHLGLNLFKMGIKGLLRKQWILNKLYYVHNPIDLDLAKKARLKVQKVSNNNKKFIVSFAGYLANYKGFDHVVRSFRIFNKKFPDSLLHVYGSSNLYGEQYETGKSGVIEKSYEESNFSDCLYDGNGNVHNSINFFGTLPREDLYLRLVNSDVFISLGVETFGVSILEAQALGLPVISRKKGGQSEIVINRKTGFLVDMSMKNIVKALEKVYVMTEVQRKNMKLNAIANASKFDYKIITKQWMLYLSLIFNYGKCYTLSNYKSSIKSWSLIGLDMFRPPNY